MVVVRVYGLGLMQKQLLMQDKLRCHASLAFFLSIYEQILILILFSAARIH